MIKEIFKVTHCAGLVPHSVDTGDGVIIYHSSATGSEELLSQVWGYDAWLKYMVIHWETLKRNIDKAETEFQSFPMWTLEPTGGGIMKVNPVKYWAGLNMAVSGYGAMY